MNTISIKDVGQVTKHINLDYVIMAQSMSETPAELVVHLQDRWSFKLAGPDKDRFLEVYKYDVSVKDVGGVTQYLNLNYMIMAQSLADAPHELMVHTQDKRAFKLTGAEKDKFLAVLEQKNVR